MLDFAKTIARYVPEGCVVKTFYIQLAPLLVKNLIPRQPPGTYTNKIRHFCLFINPLTNIIFAGIEVLVYLTFIPGQNLNQYIFVSKCDTVGLERVPGIRVSLLIEGVLSFITNFNVNLYGIHQPQEDSDKRHPSQARRASLSHTFFDTRQNHTSVTLHNAVRLLQQDPGIFLHWSHYQALSTPKISISAKASGPPIGVQNVSISLFARAAPQYLFPLLANSPHKHLLSGEKLVAWWLNVIDRVTSPADLSHSSKWQGRLLIPGTDTRAIERYLIHFSKTKWLPGCIFAQDLENLAIASVPLFPDDPKGRFLEHVVVEERYRKFTTLAFYHELGYRQEFRTSDIVGLLGCSHVNVPVPPSKMSQQAAVGLKGYKAIVEILQATDFSNKTDTIKTIAERIPGRLKDHNCAFAEVMGKCQSLDGKNNNALSKTTPKTVNSLNHLVKRKKQKLA